MNLRHIYITVMILMTSSVSFGQNDIFNFEVFTPEKGVYEVSFEFYQVIDVKMIQIDLYNEETLIGSYEAMISKKPDNNYYMFFNQKEQLVYMDDLKLVFKREFGSVNLGQQFLEVRLMDSNFSIIDRYRKEIN